MFTKYQLVFIGNSSVFIDEIKKTFLRHIIELGVDTDAVIFIDENNFDLIFAENAPAYCLYFGVANSLDKNTNILATLLAGANIILPVVDNLDNFSSKVPPEIKNINGIKLESIGDIEAIVSCILEGLGLLRLARRLFISYKRDESTGVAIQLFEQLEKAGFRVFLDTHSVPKGTDVQEELWHSLADTDVVVLLNTPGFLESEWTTDELARANAMSIGILQLVWPGHKQDVSSLLCIPFELQKDDFLNPSLIDKKSQLEENVLKKIISDVESLRARSLASRQDNIITEFLKAAVKQKVDVILQAEKLITIKRKDGKDIVLIPTVGVPHAFTYHQSEDLVKKIRSGDVAETYLLFDHNNIRQKWLDHLAWLDGYLKIKSIKIFGVENKIIELYNGIK